jgi:regulator of CtrA degradation
MAERDTVTPSAAPEAFTGGKLFDTVFSRGMALVEETAAYLDGPGREQAKTLPREAGLTYSAWSMELTTRLMQAASWLVMQKAVRDGEMRREDASARKYRIKRDEPPLDPTAQKGRGLPQRFLDLVGRAEALYEQICRLDEALYQPGSKQKPAANPVSDQLAALQKAAETGAFDPLMIWRKSK